MVKFLMTTSCTVTLNLLNVHFLCNVCIATWFPTLVARPYINNWLTCVLIVHYQHTIFSQGNCKACSPKKKTPDFFNNKNMYYLSCSKANYSMTWLRLPPWNDQLTIMFIWSKSALPYAVFGRDHAFKNCWESFKLWTGARKDMIFWRIFK